MFANPTTNHSVVPLTPEVRLIPYFSQFDKSDSDVDVPRPWINEVINMDFVTFTKLDQHQDMMVVIETRSYLGLDNTQYLEEFVWRLGEKQSLFESYFTVEKDEKHETQQLICSLKSHETVIERELSRFIQQPRFQYVHGVRYLLSIDEHLCPNAVMVGNLRLLKWAHSSGCVLRPDLLVAAADGGYVEILKWLIEQHGFLLDEEICNAAVKKGHIEVLKWLHAKECPWGKFTCSLAAMNGQFNTLKWLRENDCPWGTVYWKSDTLLPQPWLYDGLLEILMWLLDNQCPWIWYAFDASAKYGYLDIMKWCWDNGFPRGTTSAGFPSTMTDLQSYNSSPSTPCSFAAYGGHLHILKWLREIGRPWNSGVCNHAAMNGHLEVLKWARGNGCPWDKYTCYYAAKNGHMDILLWAHENGCPWDVMVCEVAAEFGRLDILKWLRENNCPWNEQTCGGAAAGGHLEILLWARANGCPWNESVCAAAARKGQIQMLKWLHDNGCPWNEGSCFQACHEGQFETLKWLRDNGCPLTSGAFNAAAGHGHLEILKWGCDNGLPMDQDTVRLYATMRGKLKVIQWLHDRGIRNNNLCSQVTQHIGRTDDAIEVIKWARNNGYRFKKAECLQHPMMFPDLREWLQAQPDDD